MLLLWLMQLSPSGLRSLVGNINQILFPDILCSNELYLSVEMRLKWSAILIRIFFLIPYHIILICNYTVHLCIFPLVVVYQILTAQTVRPCPPLHLASARLRWFPRLQLLWPPCLPSPPLGSTAPLVALTPHFLSSALRLAHLVYLAHHRSAMGPLAVRR